MTFAEFIADPTREDWDHEVLEQGWTPDGSSASPDQIQGVRVGITSTDWEKNLARDGRLYAASWHDLLYQRGRRLKLPWHWCAAADAIYRDRCLDHVAHLIGWSGWKARAKAWNRWRVLRVRCQLMRLLGFSPYGDPPT